MTDQAPQSADLTTWSATELAAGFRAGTVTAAEITEAHLARAERFDAGLGAFVQLDSAGARRRAADLDARRADGAPDLGPLAAVPVALKDNLMRAGHPTGCASRILADFVSPYDATSVARLEAAGAVLIGRTNMDEFGMGSSTEHTVHGPTHNPHDLSRTAGGSSGGSAAAVAAGFAPLAIGSDTGGSVRQPAAFCGIAGLKPTYGRVSRYGLVAYASSLDTVAPFARSVADLALCLDVLTAEDPRDPTSVAVSSGMTATTLEDGIAGLRIGVPAEAFALGVDPSTESAVRAALAALEGAGARIVPIDLPHTAHAVATYYVLCTSEASSNLARYDGVRYGHRARPAAGERPFDLDTMYARSRAEGFGTEVKLRILLGTYCLSSGAIDAYYGHATKVRALIRQDYTDAFASHCDLIAMPTTLGPAFELGGKVHDRIATYRSDALTVGPSLAGIPALSVPCGTTDDGLPVGLQLVAPAFDEATLLRAARAYEKVAPTLPRPSLPEPADPPAATGDQETDR